MKFVYLIRGNNGKYKIGIAKEPKRRIKQLQTGNSDELTIIETYQSENASKIETALHNRYSHLQNVGEWFDLSINEEVKFINLCKQIDYIINDLRDMGNIFI